MNNIELQLAPGIKHSARDVILPPGLSVEQWRDYGRFTKHAEQSLAFWKARWFYYGRQNFGDEVVRETVTQLQMEFADLEAVSALNNLEERWDDLSTEHHFVLSKLPAHDQQPWAAQAKENKLSPRELQLSIKKGVITKITPEPSSGRAGLATIEGVRALWNLWRQQIGDSYEGWSAEDLQRCMAEMVEMDAFYRELEMLLAARAGLAERAEV